MNVYEFRDLTFVYGSTPVLHDVSGRIEAGEFVALVGPNGAGKSTLLKILAGLLRKASGTLHFLGRPMDGYKAGDLARKAAFVAQETHVVFPFTVDEMILMGRVPHRAGLSFDDEEEWERVCGIMEATETLQLSGKIFNQLSGGERQRVVLASALAQDPKVLLLDEPTVYLDLKHQIEFYGILERLNAERGTTIISVTHDINLAARYARRMITICGGMFRADGAPAEVLTPANIYETFGIHAEVLPRSDGQGRYIVPTA